MWWPLILLEIKREIITKNSTKIRVDQVLQNLTAVCYIILNYFSDVQRNSKEKLQSTQNNKKYIKIRK